MALQGLGFIGIEVHGTSVDATPYTEHSNLAQGMWHGDRMEHAGETTAAKSENLKISLGFKR